MLTQFPESSTLLSTPGLTEPGRPPIIPAMMKYALPLALLGLLLTPSCRHHRGSAQGAELHTQHEEATPVSHLPSAEFSRVTSHH